MGEVKKYKSEVGSWQNFSWNEPTGRKATTLKKMAEKNDKPSLINVCKKLVKCVVESNTKMNNIVKDMAVTEQIRLREYQLCFNKELTEERDKDLQVIINSYYQVAEWLAK